MPWKLRRSKSVEALSNQRIRITAADEKCKSDEKCKKTSKLFGTLTRKSGEKFAPVVPPRPTEKAIANAKRSPTRKRYVELDLSGGHTDGQSVPQLIPQTDPGAAEYVGQRSRSLPTKVAQTRTARSTRTASVSAGLENRVASSRLIQRSPSVKASLSTSTYACAGSIQSACTLPRPSPSGRRASAPTTPAAINSKRDRKLTGINANESVYKPRTTSLNGTGIPGSPCSSKKLETLPPKHLQFRSFRHPSPGSPCSSRKSEPALTTRDLQLRHPSPSGSPCSSRKSESMTREVYISHSSLGSPHSSRKLEYIKPKDLFLRHPSSASPSSSRKSEPALTTGDRQPRQTSPASSPAIATPTLSSPSSAKRPEAPKRPEPPKIERAPVPLPRTKKRDSEYSATVLSLTSRQEEVKAEENDYEYIHFEPRHVVVPNAYLDTESKVDGSSDKDSGVYTALKQLTLDKTNEYAVPSIGHPTPDDPVPTETMSDYMVMNPVIPNSVANKKEESKNKEEESENEEDEYILPETLADYVNVPQFFQLPTSPPRTGSGIYSPLATSMMDDTPLYMETKIQSQRDIEPYAVTRRAS